MCPSKCCQNLSRWLTYSCWMERPKNITTPVSKWFVSKIWDSFGNLLCFGFHGSCFISVQFCADTSPFRLETLFVLHCCHLHTGLGHSLQDSLSCASSCFPIAIVLNKHLLHMSLIQLMPASAGAAAVAAAAVPSGSQLLLSIVLKEIVGSWKLKRAYF